jgi:hypothetical protein
VGRDDLRHAVDELVIGGQRRHAFKTSRRIGPRAASQPIGVRWSVAYAVA